LQDIATNDFFPQPKIGLNPKNLVVETDNIINVLYGSDLAIHYTL